MERKVGLKILILVLLAAGFLVTFLVVSVVHLEELRRLGRVEPKIYLPTLDPATLEPTTDFPEFTTMEGSTDNMDSTETTNDSTETDIDSTDLTISPDSIVVEKVTHKSIASEPPQPANSTSRADLESDAQTAYGKAKLRRTIPTGKPILSKYTNETVGDASKYLESIVAPPQNKTMVPQAPSTRQNHISKSHVHVHSATLPSVRLSTPPLLQKTNLPRVNPTIRSSTLNIKEPPRAATSTTRPKTTQESLPSHREGKMSSVIFSKQQEPGYTETFVLDNQHRHNRNATGMRISSLGQKESNSPNSESSPQKSLSVEHTTISRHSTSSRKSADELKSNHTIFQSKISKIPGQTASMHFSDSELQNQKNQHQSPVRKSHEANVKPFVNLPTTSERPESLQHQTLSRTKIPSNRSLLLPSSAPSHGFRESDIRTTVQGTGNTTIPGEVRVIGAEETNNIQVSKPALPIRFPQLLTSRRNKTYLATSRQPTTLQVRRPPHPRNFQHKRTQSSDPTAQERTQSSDPTAEDQADLPKSGGQPSLGKESSGSTPKKLLQHGGGITLNSETYQDSSGQIVTKQTSLPERSSSRSNRPFEQRTKQSGSTRINGKPFGRQSSDAISQMPQLRSNPVDSNPTQKSTGVDQFGKLKSSPTDPVPIKEMSILLSLNPQFSNPRFPEHTSVQKEIITTIPQQTNNSSKITPLAKAELQLSSHSAESKVKSLDSQALAAGKITPTPLPSRTVFAREPLTSVSFLPVLPSVAGNAVPNLPGFAPILLNYATTNAGSVPTSKYTSYFYPGTSIPPTGQGKFFSTVNQGTSGSSQTSGIPGVLLPNWPTFSILNQQFSQPDLPVTIVQNGKSISDSGTATTSAGEGKEARVKAPDFVSQLQGLYPQLIQPLQQLQQKFATTPQSLLPSVQNGAVVQQSFYHFQGKDNFHWAIQRSDGTGSEQRGYVRNNANFNNNRENVAVLEGLYSVPGTNGRIYATKYIYDENGFRPEPFGEFYPPTPSYRAVQVGQG